MTVQELIDLLAAYPKDREVVFLDPDTEWWMPVIVREPKPERGELEGQDGRNPVFVTSDYYPAAKTA